MKFILLSVLSFATLANTALAVEWTLPQNSEQPKAAGVFQVIASPFMGFLSGLRETGEQTFPGLKGVPYERLTPKTIARDIDAWFERITGVKFSVILKAIGNFFVWLLTFIVDLLKWGLKFITDFFN